MAQTYDNKANGQFADMSSSLTVNITVGNNSDRYLVAYVMGGYFGTRPAVSSITATKSGADTAMSSLADTGGANSQCRVQAYGIVAPDTGTVAVKVNLDNDSQGRFVVLVVSYYGIHQTTPVRGTPGTYYHDVNDPTVTLSGANVDAADLVVDGAGMAAPADNTLACDGSQTSRITKYNSVDTTTGVSGGCSEKAGASSVTMSWSGGVGGGSAQVALALIAAASGPQLTLGGTILDGVTKANVNAGGKVITLALASQTWIPA